jgi:RimJ/RimL family protein N-acetyltransferase
MSGSEGHSRPAVTLREVRDADLPIFFEHQRDPETTLMVAMPARGWDEFMAHWRSKVLGDGSARVRVIVVDDQVAGNVGIWDRDGARLVGYVIGREFWGKGIATAALTEFVKGELDRPLHAHVALTNAASIRVLEKCGFVRVPGDPVRAADGVDEVVFRLEG